MLDTGLTMLGTPVFIIPNPCDLRETILEFIALLRICKRFTAEITKEYAKFAKFYFEALCFNEDAEFNDPVFAPLPELFKIRLHKSIRHPISGIFNISVIFALHPSFIIYHS
jgi:hypothetical protein